MERLRGILHGEQRVSGALSGQSRVSGSIEKPQNVHTEEYTGPYVFTPGAAEQTIEIENKKAVSNIIINPIPDNWGLITWNGSYLTVS